MKEMKLKGFQDVTEKDMIDINFGGWNDGPGVNLQDQDIMTSGGGGSSAIGLVSPNDGKEGLDGFFTEALGGIAETVNGWFDAFGNWITGK